MFSGKTTHLFNEINKYKQNNEYNIIVINHILDKQRHSENFTFIENHNQERVPAIMLNKLDELKQEYKDIYDKSNVVIIDEGQFYEDLYSFIFTELKSSNLKIFIVAGLSGDYNQNSIGDIHKLVSLADDIKHLSAYCAECSDLTLAPFTKKIHKENLNQIEIGNNNLYSPVCRKHLINNAF
jgi:thymidine kinase